MATLTPELATSLMQRSMSTGVPTAEFDSYGGYNAVKNLYNSGGGAYSLEGVNPTILNSLATQVANTGVGDLQILKSTNTPLTTAGQQAMNSNGVVMTNQMLKDQSIPYTGFLSAGVSPITKSTLTPALAKSLMQRSMTTGLPKSESDRYGGYAAIKAMYDADGGAYSLDGIDPGLLKSLATDIANTGVGDLQVLKQTNTPLTGAGRQAMISNGVSITDQMLKDQNIPINYSPTAFSSNTGDRLGVGGATYESDLIKSLRKSDNSLVSNNPGFTNYGYKGPATNTSLLTQFGPLNSGGAFSPGILTQAEASADDVANWGDYSAYRTSALTANSPVDSFTKWLEAKNNPSTVVAPTKVATRNGWYNSETGRPWTNLD